MTFFLSQKSVRTSAAAKAILVGEHSAVYGYPALAVGLPDVRLEMELCAPQFEPVLPKTWEDAFEFTVRGMPVTLGSEQKQKLVTGLSTCVFQSAGEFTLADFRPQPIRISSEIPMGAGMGGSAALSTAMVRMVDKLRGMQSHDLAARANLVDCVFHGVASGLDTAAVAGDGTVIEFVRNRGPVNVFHPCTFWLVLVDSGTRAATSDMIAHVADLRRSRPAMVDEVMETLGEIASRTRMDVELGRIADMGCNMSEAHNLLCQLGVSTGHLNDIVKGLMNNGAVGAKVTGAGGGGVVLGLFDHDPVTELLSLAQFGQVYYTRVAPTSFEERYVGSGDVYHRAYV